MPKIRILKQNIDERGIFVELFRKDKLGEFKQVNIGTIKPGCSRGGHYHKKRKEWFCVIQGKCSCRLENLKTKKRNEVVLNGDGFRLIEVLPMNHHEIVNIGDGEAVFVYAISTLYNKKSSDTYKV